MTFLSNNISSSALPREDGILRAIFSQITAEVRKRGIILDDENGSFYVSERFGWKSAIKKFFDAYHSICERKQVTPIYQEGRLGSAMKVPYASIETINLLHDSTLKRILQFKERRVPPFSKLPDNPSNEDLLRIREQASDDDDICRFIDTTLLIDEELRQYVAQLDELAAAYRLRVSAFSLAARSDGADDAAKKKYEDSKRTIERILSPYIDKLKKLKIIPETWQYSFKALPLTEECKEQLGTRSAIDCWNNDALPLGLSGERKAHKPDKAKDKKPGKAKARKSGKEKKELDLSHPSLWERFDKGVSKIGNWFSDRLENLSDKAVIVWFWILLAAGVISIIVVWVSDGFWAALFTVIILLVIIGLLSSVLEIVLALLAGISLVVTYVPVFILRWIFYRGWTLLTTILLIGSLLAFLLLRTYLLV